MKNKILDGWFLCLICGRFWSCERVVDGKPITVKIDDREEEQLDQRDRRIEELVDRLAEMNKAFHGLTAEEQLDMVSTCPECREIGSGGVGD